MPFTLTVDMPNLGSSQEVYIHGLGTFAGGTHKISDEQAEQFSLINSKSGYGAPDENGNMKIVAIPGPTLETAVAGMYGVTIERDNTDSKSDMKAVLVEQEPVKQEPKEQEPVETAEQATAASRTEVE